MSVIEYVGMRYIPKVAEPLEWNSANEYEYFTIVQYLGDTYLSTKNVPANTQITNTDYWIRIANFNSQYESIRNLIKELNNAIELNSNKISTLENDIDTLENDIDTLENDIDTLENNVTTKTSASLYLGNDIIGKVEKINNIVYLHIYYYLNYDLTGGNTILIPEGFRPNNRIDATNDNLKITISSERPDVIIPYATANHTISIDLCYMVS